MKRPVCWILALVLAGGCGDSGEENGPGDGPITHPSTPDEVVLQIRTSGGGPPPPGFLNSLRSLPSVTIYGDGTAVRRDSSPDGALDLLEQATLSEAGLQIILRDAADAGLLEGDVYYDRPDLADFGSLSITITADDVTSRVGVYAPFEEGGENAKERAEVVEFRERFFDLPGWVGAEITPWANRELDRVLVVVVPSLDPPFTFGDPEYREWGYGDLDDPNIYTGDRAGEPCFILEEDELAAALPDLITATLDTVWRSATRDYQVVLRPLLPHETLCE